MNLNDYIALSSERPNRAVLQGLGASEELIEYLMETPNNTNWNVVGSLSESESKRTVLVSGEVTTTEYHGQCLGGFEEDFYVDDNIQKLIVTIDNIEYIIPKDTGSLFTSPGYGETNNSNLIFTHYPIYIKPNLYSCVYTESAGTYSIKIEIEDN